MRLRLRLTRRAGAQLDDGTSYLDADLNIKCYDRTHWSYMGGAIVWLVLVPLVRSCRTQS